MIIEFNLMTKNEAKDFRVGTREYILLCEIASIVWLVTQQSSILICTFGTADTKKLLDKNFIVTCMPLSQLQVFGPGWL